MALFTSPGWQRASTAVADPRLRTLALTTTVMVYAQILLGATMRHRDAGLAIPDFPLAFGRLIPHVWNTDIAVHFAHRTFALVVTAAALMTVRHVLKTYRDNPGLRRAAQLLLALILVQVTLGAFVVLTGLQPLVNTAHVVNGALVLATSLVLTLRSFRAAFDRLPARTADTPLVNAAPAGARS
jgi:cytochrome c oxidase assembly protein subunit 15